MERFVRKLLGDMDPDHMITGMALGWDQYIAGACVSLGIPFTAAVPFIGQESRWSEEQKSYYRFLLDHAKEVVVVSKGGYSPKKMMIRNLWIVDNSSELLTLWDGDKLGGTWNTIQAAEEIDLPITHAMRPWLHFRDTRELTRR